MQSCDPDEEKRNNRMSVSLIIDLIHLDSEAQKPYRKPAVPDLRILAGSEVMLLIDATQQISQLFHCLSSRARSLCVTRNATAA